ncbi:energy transducer TonB [Dysgonomonas sp. 25]|uniref:energy transducer TonB n=1 Tax=Dysgonomonas sp. 25 TaxID=2302933 RepID=UPI0013D5C81B|nr:TonB family protein [Dysgonomonas sp. 25]
MRKITIFLFLTLLVTCIQSKAEKNDASLPESEEYVENPKQRIMTPKLKIAIVKKPKTTSEGVKLPENRICTCEDNGEPKPLSWPKYPPQYPGGEKALEEYIKTNFKYPEPYFEKELHAKILLRFVINTSGETDQVRVLKGFNPTYDREAVRVMKFITQKWTPAKDKGETVSAYVTMEISIDID